MTPISDADILKAVKRSGVIVKRCEWCKEPFVAKQPHGRFCCDACRVRQHKFFGARKKFVQAVKEALANVATKKIDFMAGIVVDGAQQFEVCLNNTVFFRGNANEVIQQAKDYARDK